MSNHTLDQTFAAIATVSEKVVHRRSRKLASVDPNSVEGFYMLAAYAFDAIRKMLYLHKATVPHLRDAAGSPSTGLSELATEVLSHEARIDAAGSDWQATAQVLEDIMLELHAEVEDEHETLLRRTAGSPE